MRSKRVGPTWATGLGLYGPAPSADGTQEGTSVVGAPGLAFHGPSIRLSQPQPGPAGKLGALCGKSPVNPSSVPPEPSSRCEPKLAVICVSKVRSEIVKFRARSASDGIWSG